MPSLVGSEMCIRDRGGGVPFGLAEDFGLAATWIASSGLDPAGMTAIALKELDCGQSCLKATLKEGNKEILLTAESGKNLSAIQAGAAVCDLISVQLENEKNMQSIVAVSYTHLTLPTICSV